MNPQVAHTILEAECLGDLLDTLLNFAPTPAILSPGRSAISYGELLRQVDLIGAFLNGHGIGRNDRVAAVLPNGPEAATAFLGVTAVASYAPLNPAYQEAEFAFYLQDLNPKALVIPLGADSPARAAAAFLNIPLIELAPSPDSEGGRFSLSSEKLPEAQASHGGRAKAEDTALILHTSGTTSHPKRVPLLQRHLLASSRHTMAALQLTGKDRCLNLMPLFHLSGLNTAVLSSLSSGGSVVCIPGFGVTEFFEWLEVFQPTWYTAVPTIQQSIADYAGLHPFVAKSTSLTQIRSSAAPLPPILLARLEDLFQVPVIESYGMTETLLIASNPRPPLARKAGSVGLPAGPEVAILGEDGSLRSRGETGEIILRGPNAFSGYEGQPEANVAAFQEGWFRTGDLGCFDADGYLFIRGRVKELINRGGQKVSPRELEEALLAHPGVRQAVAFPMSHRSLGEAVAAAIVPSPGTVLSEPALRQFLAERVAPYKVPLRILCVGEIPKNAAGKIQRSALAEHWKEALTPGVHQAFELDLAEATSEEWAEAIATESVLLRHPAVLRCAVLPKRDSKGQFHLVAFAVVRPEPSRESPSHFILREGSSCIIPSAFVALGAMPRDSEGRVDFAKLRALPVLLEQVRQPMEIVELILAQIWEETLNDSPAELTDDFFQSGGDSLKAVELLLRIEREIGVRVAPEAFFRCATLGSLVGTLQDGAATSAAPIIFVQAGSDRKPFFFVHGDFNGWGFHCPRFARLLGENQAFYTFQPDGLPGQPDPTTIEAMADRYLPFLREAQPRGPYLLGGYCNGALVAFELAKRLDAQGEKVELLVLVSPPAVAELGRSADKRPPIPPGIQIQKQTTLIRREILTSLYAHAMTSYQPGTFAGSIHLLATAMDLKRGGTAMGWEALANRVEVHEIPGNHHSIFSRHIEDLAATIKALLA